MKMLWTVETQLTHHRAQGLVSAVTSSVQLSAGLVSCCTVSLLYLIVAAAHLRHKNWGSRCRHINKLPSDFLEKNFIDWIWTTTPNSFHCTADFNPVKVTLIVTINQHSSTSSTYFYHFHCRSSSVQKYHNTYTHTHTVRPGCHSYELFIRWKSRQPASR